MLQFIHISDTHIGATPDFTLHGRNTLNCARKLVRYLNEELPFAPDFVLHTGDVTNDYEESAARLAAETLAELQYPIYYVVGNHDNPALMRQYYFQQPGGNNAPIFYDFTVQDFHFLVLDTRGKPDPQGYVSENQLQWLTETAANSPARSLVVVVHHFPLKTGNPWYDRDMRIMNEEAFYAALKPLQPKLRGVFFGHIHHPYTAYRDGIVFSGAPSAAFQIYSWPEMQRSQIDNDVAGGYSIVTMTHDQTTVAHHFLSGDSWE